jgi:hypothetical protein
VCDATALPHCGHLFRCGACQRFAALRVRKRIFDVLRFGTPMAGGYESMVLVKNNPAAWVIVTKLHHYNCPTYNFVTFVIFLTF